MSKFKVFILILFLVVIAGHVHSKLTVPPLAHEGKVAAYRAGGLLLDYSRLDNNACGARTVLESEFPHPENTIEAAQFSVDAGAEILHLNVHVTLDKQLVVFHDWKLSCATNGEGKINKLNYTEISKFDAGWGYTNDEGLSFPFRNKGYRIHLLKDYVNRFPDKTFWLNLKQNNNDAFGVLDQFIQNNFDKPLKNTLVITTKKGLNWFAINRPLQKVLSYSSNKKCLQDYLAVGWAGLFPKSCHNVPLFIPPEFANLMWGYPEVFAARAQQHGSEIFLWNKHLGHSDLESKIKQGVGLVTGDVRQVLSGLKTAAY